MPAALLLGLSLGLGAGLSPGPLLTLVITATLERGFGAGLRVALAPFVTDLPIILVTLLFLNSLPDVAVVGLTLAGGLFVLYLGVETVRAAPNATLATDSSLGSQQDLWKGALVNMLSPHPWLFWLTVGGPLVLQLGQRSLVSAGLFLAGFYGLLVGSKIFVAWAIASGRRYLSERWYRRLLALAGLALIALGLLLAYQAASGLPR